MCVYLEHSVSFAYSSTPCASRMNPVPPPGPASGLVVLFLAQLGALRLWLSPDAKAEGPVCPEALPPPPADCQEVVQFSCPEAAPCLAGYSGWYVVGVGLLALFIGAVLATLVISLFVEAQSRTRPSKLKLGPTAAPPRHEGLDKGRDASGSPDLVPIPW